MPKKSRDAYRHSIDKTVKKCYCFRFFSPKGGSMPTKKYNVSPFVGVILTALADAGIHRIPEHKVYPVDGYRVQVGKCLLTFGRIARGKPKAGRFEAFLDVHYVGQDGEPIVHLLHNGGEILNLRAEYTASSNFRELLKNCEDTGRDLRIRDNDAHIGVWRRHVELTLKCALNAL